MKKLKPCPFCGTPYPYVTFEKGYLDDSAVVFCNICKISVKLEENDQEGFNDETKSKAIEAWNKRALEQDTCDDLISRQTLMKEFSNFVRDSNNSDFAQTPTWNNAVSLVESMPSAQPKQKGRWHIEEKDSIYGKKYILTCSECGDIYAVSEDALLYEKYCRNCGSRNLGGE